MHLVVKARNRPVGVCFVKDTVVQKIIMEAIDDERDIGIEHSSVHGNMLLLMTHDLIKPARTFAYFARYKHNDILVADRDIDMVHMRAGETIRKFDALDWNFEL